MKQDEKHSPVPWNSPDWAIQGKRNYRAQAWQKVADNLNKQAAFKVTKRSVQDHYKVLVEKFKKKASQALQASGIIQEPTELDRILEEIVEIHVYLMQVSSPVMTRITGYKRRSGMLMAILEKRN